MVVVDLWYSDRLYCHVCNLSCFHSSYYSDHLCVITAMLQTRSPPLTGQDGLGDRVCRGQSVEGRLAPAGLQPGVRGRQGGGQQGSAGLAQQSAGSGVAGERSPAAAWLGLWGGQQAGGSPAWGPAYTGEAGGGGGKLGPGPGARGGGAPGRPVLILSCPYPPVLPSSCPNPVFPSSSCLPALLLPSSCPPLLHHPASW